MGWGGPSAPLRAGKLSDLRPHSNTGRGIIRLGPAQFSRMAAVDGDGMLIRQLMAAYLAIRRSKRDHCAPRRNSGVFLPPL